MRKKIPRRRVTINGLKRCFSHDSELLCLLEDDALWARVSEMLLCGLSLDLKILMRELPASHWRQSVGLLMMHESIPINGLNFRPTVQSFAGMGVY